MQKLTQLSKDPEFPLGVSLMLADGLNQHQAARILQVSISTFQKELLRAGIHYMDLRRQAASVTCPDCQQLVGVHGVARANHRRGVYHQQSKRIRALLAEDCIGHAKIARRLGVTRERVRQIVAQLGQETGRERRRACRLVKAGDTARAGITPRHVPSPLKERLEKLGDAIQTVGRWDRGRWEPSPNLAIINGRRCAFKLANSSSATRTGGFPYYRFGRSRKVADVDICYATDAKTAWIIPRAEMPRTAFIPTIELKQRRNSRDWDQYKERWDLLGVEYGDLR